MITLTVGMGALHSLQLTPCAVLVRRRYSCTAMGGTSMREFCDARAGEDPYYFVDNRLEYGAPDKERFWEAGRRDFEAMLDLLGARIEPSDDVVEIGCGVGRITRVLAEQADTVRAIDVSERMLDLAAELNPDLGNVRWMLGDGRSLDGIDTASVDVVHSHVVFQHIPDPEITLSYVREMGRVLRPGGWAAFHVSNDPSLHRRRPLRVRIRGSMLALLGRAPRGQANKSWLGSAIDLRRLTEASAEADMKVGRIVGEGTPNCLLLLQRI
jgi:SAM-dependent methyltransferase